MNICAVMIIKDEDAVLRACLESVKPYVNSVCVVDTGSIPEQYDECANIIYEVFGNNSFYISRSWVNFAYNRSQALRLAKFNCDPDYMLMIDADDRLEPGAVFDLRDNADAYYMQIVHGNIVFPRLQLFKADGGWQYRGVLHEFPEHASGNPKLSALAVKMLTSRGGARSADPYKYAKDAGILAATIDMNAEPDLKSRYTFYLAQSYRDAGIDELAVENYYERTKLGGYEQEIYISYLEAGRALLRMGKFDDALKFFDLASKQQPHRLEAAHSAARALREAGRFADALEVCRAHPNRKMPDGTLFAEPAVYAYMMDDEHSVSAYWSNAHREALSYSMRALTGYTDLDIDTRRMVANVGFALSRNGFSDVQF